MAAGGYARGDQDQLNPFNGPAYSITLVACTSIEFGNLMPMALAVFMLIANSSVVGCATGKSPGFAPRRILSIPRFIDSPKNRLPWGDFGIRDGA